MALAPSTAAKTRPDRLRAGERLPDHVAQVGPVDVAHHVGALDEDRPPPRDGRACMPPERTMVQAMVVARSCFSAQSLDRIDLPANAFTNGSSTTALSPQPMDVVSTKRAHAGGAGRVDDVDVALAVQLGRAADEAHHLQAARRRGPGRRRPLPRAARDRPRPPRRRGAPPCRGPAPGKRPRGRSAPPAGPAARAGSRCRCRRRRRPGSPGWGRGWSPGR